MGGFIRHIVAFYILRYSDADYPSAVLSSVLVRRSGLANFNQVELGQIFNKQGSKFIALC